MATNRCPVRSIRRAVFWVLLPVFLSLAVWQWTLHQRRPTFRMVTGPGELRLHTKSTGDVEFTLKPDAVYSFKFDVPGNHLDASLKGQFSVAPGSGGGIEVYVLSGEDYASWQNGYTTFRYYDSGNGSQGGMNVSLLSDSAGTYFVVFNNKVPSATAKRIRANMSVKYYTRWWPGLDE